MSHNLTFKSTTHNEEHKISNILKAVLLTAFLLVITACEQNPERTTPETPDISATVSARVQETKQAERHIEETVEAKIEQTREPDISATVSARVQETKQAERRIEETVQAKIEQTREAEISPTPTPTPTPAPGENERLDKIFSEYYDCIQNNQNFRQLFIELSGQEFTKFMEAMIEDKSTFLAMMKLAAEEDPAFKELFLLISEIIEDESICNTDS